MARFGLSQEDSLKAPRGLRIYGARRPLRVRIGEVGTRWAEGALELEFTLPAGSYATVLVGELFPGELEEGRPQTDPLEDDEAH